MPSSVRMTDDVNNQMYNQTCIVDQPLHKKSSSAFTQNTLSSQNLLYKSPITSSLTRKSLDYISKNAEKQFTYPCEKVVSDISDYTTKVSSEFSTEQPYLRTSVIQESSIFSTSNQKYTLLEIDPIVSEYTPECRNSMNALPSAQVHHTRSQSCTSTTIPTPSMTTPRYYQTLSLNNSTDAQECSDKHLTIIKNFPAFDLKKSQTDANIQTTGYKTEFRSSRETNSHFEKSFLHLLKSPTPISKTLQSNLKNYPDSSLQDRGKLKNTPRVLSCIPEQNGEISEDSFKMFIESSTANTSISRNTSNVFCASVESTDKTLKNTPRICFPSPSLNSSTSKTCLNTFFESPLSNKSTSRKLLKIFSKPATPGRNSKSLLRNFSNSPAESLEISQKNNTFLSDSPEENINQQDFNLNLLVESTQNRFTISETLIVSLESPPRRISVIQDNSDVLPDSPKPSQPLPLPRSSLASLNNELTELDTIVSPTKNKDVLMGTSSYDGFSNDEYALEKNRVSETNTTYINTSSKQTFFMEEPRKTLNNFNPRLLKRQQDSTKRRWSVVSEVFIPSNGSLNSRKPIIEHKRKKLNSHPTVLRRSRSDSSTFLNLNSQGLHVNDNLSNLVEYPKDTKHSYMHIKHSESPAYLPELGKNENLLKNTIKHETPKELNLDIKSSPCSRTKQFVSLEKTQGLQNATTNDFKEDTECFNHNQIRPNAALINCNEANSTRTDNLTKEQKSKFFYLYHNKPENLIRGYVDAEHGKHDGLRTSTKSSETSSPLHLSNKVDFHECPTALNFCLLKNKNKTNCDSKILINPVLSMASCITNGLEDNDGQTLNFQSQNRPCQSPKKHQIHPDPRRVSWLFMEGSPLENITAKSSTTPISLQKTFENHPSTACSEKRDCSLICPEEDMASPLLSYQTSFPNPVTVKSFIENSHLPLRRSIIITDEILFANEGLTKISKPDIPPSSTHAPFSNCIETFEEPSLLKRNPSQTMIFPKSRIPRLRRRKRFFHQQSTFEELEASVSNFTNKNLVKNSDCSLKRSELPSNNFFFTSTNACGESKFIHTNALGPPRNFHKESSTRTIDVTRTQTVDKLATFSQNKLSRYRDDTSKSYYASSKLPRLM
jgi:hypothetical protein